MLLASTAYNYYLDFFAKVKGNPERDQKGAVRVHLSRSGATTQPSWKAHATNRCSSQDYADPASVAPDAVANQAGGGDGVPGCMIPVGNGAAPPVMSGGARHHSDSRNFVTYPDSASWTAQA